MSQRLLNALIADGFTVVLGLIAYFIVRRTRVDPTQPVSVDALKHQAEVDAGIPVATAGIAILSVITVAALLGAPWWSSAVMAPLGLWALWWAPPRRRRATSQASVIVSGSPSRVSAFVADVPNRKLWDPSVVSYTPQPAGARGPRFLAVEQAPGGRQMTGTYVLTRDDPGVEVDLLVEGAGATGDYFTFAAQDGGTLVTQRTVVELPYLLALIGGTLISKGIAGEAQLRRINDVQALKTAFESQP